MRREGLTTTSIELHICLVAEFSRQLESCSIDNAVDFELLAVCHDSLLCYILDSLSLGVHEPDVRLVEGLQVLIMETGALTELIKILASQQHSQSVFRGCVGAVDVV